MSRNTSSVIDRMRITMDCYLENQENEERKSLDFFLLFDLVSFKIRHLISMLII